LPFAADAAAVSEAVTRPWTRTLPLISWRYLPLYRQAQIYARQGVRLDRSTLADWVGRAAFHLRPVHERILAHLKSSTKLFADEKGS
jgi:hypothetical protein